MPDQNDELPRERRHRDVVPALAPHPEEMAQMLADKVQEAYAELEDT